MPALVVLRVEGEAVNKLIIDPESEMNKSSWMKALMRAKMQDTDMTGYMGFEVRGNSFPHVPSECLTTRPSNVDQVATKKKWVRFEQRYFVVGPGRLEMYANEDAVNIDNFISIVPLEACEILDNPKKKRPDAPLSFRLNVDLKAARSATIN